MDSGIETNDSTGEADKLSKVRLVKLILPFSDSLNIRSLCDRLADKYDNCRMTYTVKCATALFKLPCEQSLLRSSFLI